MRVIGLTGGVGSGKSFVARYLQEYFGMELLIADDLGRQVMEPGTDCFHRIVDCFGEQVVRVDGTLDRNHIAKIIFNDPGALADMNAIVHPAVKDYMDGYIRDRRDKEGTILLETAILYETQCDRLCDEVWYVYVPADIRMQRLMQDRGYTEEKSRSIMADQQTEEYFRARADRVIDNSGSVEELRRVLKSIVPFEKGQV